jgi:two-component system OmpR family response regulator
MPARLAGMWLAPFLPNLASPPRTWNDVLRAGRRNGSGTHRENPAKRGAPRAPETSKLRVKDWRTQSFPAAIRGKDNALMSLAASPLPVRHILVVDDDAPLRDEVAAYLGDHGFCVHTVGSGPAMEEVLRDQPIDLMILDVRLPGEDGLSICRRLADRGGPAIVMMSAMADEVDRVLGLEMGADDYLSKPCSPRELLARVRAVMRRFDEVRYSSPRSGKLYKFLGFVADGLRRQVQAPNGATILLTAGEFSLLTVFLEQPQRILSREELLELARGGHTEVFDRAVDVQISRLRRKLHACVEGEIIRTFRGAGYMFDAKVTRA